jgi:3-deoxy-manno-octulosonate cytidylyltransferase (CMP-KDO synthetase)
VSRAEVCDFVAVATCDRKIADYIASIGGKAIMTSKGHERASDRCAEALEILEQEIGERFDIVVMVQGDEPMTHPEMIQEAVQPMLEDEKILVTNLLGNIHDEKDFEDRNCIKVVCNLNYDALYFSREPIPTRSKVSAVPMYKQVCIIPFRRDYLLEYSNLKPTPLELLESVDMMRVLEHGDKVRMVPTEHQTCAVDTPEDLKRVEKIMMEQSQ